MPVHGIRTVYQPFSLQERMAPLNMMKEEYDRVNEGLADLEMTANQATQYIDPSSQAGQTLAQYNKQLEDAAGVLSREGLKGLSRTALQNLKRVYQSQVAPINEGAKNYAALQAQIKQMQWKDPTIMVSDMPTLDDYIKNPNSLPNLVSGSQLMKEGATAALQLQGVDYDAISRYMKGDTSAIPNLEQSVQQIAQSYGVSSQQALDYISRGVISGLGERATKLDMARQNAEMEFDYKRRLEEMQNGRYYSGLREQKRQHDLAALQSGYVYNKDTKSWEFSQEALDNASKAYQATHKSAGGAAASSQNRGKQGYSTHITIYDENGSISGEYKDINSFNNSQIEGTIRGKKGDRKQISLTNLPASVKQAVIDSAGIDYRDERYLNANGTVNWDLVIEEYYDILNEFEYQEFTDKKGKKHYKRELRNKDKSQQSSTSTEASNPKAGQIETKYGVGNTEGDGSDYIPQ